MKRSKSKNVSQVESLEARMVARHEKIMHTILDAEEANVRDFTAVFMRCARADAREAARAAARAETAKAKRAGATKAKPAKTVTSSKAPRKPAKASKPVKAPARPKQAKRGKPDRAVQAKAKSRG